MLSYSLTFEDNGSYETTRERNLTLNGVAYRVLQILAENGDSLLRDFHIIIDENGEYAFDVGEGFTLSRFKADIYGHPLIDDLTPEEASATAAEMIEYLSGGGVNGFSIVLYGENAYIFRKNWINTGLPAELTKQEVLDIATMRYKLNTNSFQRYMAVTIATNVQRKYCCGSYGKSESAPGHRCTERIPYASMLMMKVWAPFLAIPAGFCRRAGTSERTEP